MFLLLLPFLLQVTQVYLASTGTSPAPCQDDPTFDCQQVASLSNICADIPHAKSVCKRFCNLCDLVDGGWANWNAWSACSVTCGNGTKSRSRTCTNPSPVHGGSNCTGASTQDSACNTQNCPVTNGVWATWSSWGPCNGGLQSRTRTCTNPAPSANGRDCRGNDEDKQLCDNTAGGWSNWSRWGGCTATCNGGLQSRTRTCTNPTPSKYGRECRGNDIDKQICNNKNCPGQKAAFSVWQTNATLTSDNSPTFGHVLLNTGSYNTTTGKFTCPIAGIYTFSVTIREDRTRNGSPNCSFRVNGQNTFSVQSYHDTFDTSAGTIVARLAVGDVVALYCGAWNHESHDQHSAFSGVLVTPT